MNEQSIHLNQQRQESQKVNANVERECLLRSECGLLVAATLMQHRGRRDDRSKELRVLRASSTQYCRYLHSRATGEGLRLQKPTWTIMMDTL